MDFHDSYRHITPPAGTEFLDPSSAGSIRSYNHSSRSFSPKSDRTHITTPPRSPGTQHGPVLLPKVRSQDQALDPVADMSQDMGHGSLTSTGFPLESTRHVSPAALSYHRSASPPDFLMTPVSAASPCDDQLWQMPYTENPSRPPLFHSRTTSTCSRKDIHSRNSSTSIDDAAIRKYICPTFRNSTGLMSTTAPILPSNHTTHSTAPTISISTTLPTLAPSFQQPEAPPTFLPAELMYETYSSPPTSTTLLDYLTSPNPSPALVRRTTQPNRLHDTHFWWDIRNTRTWSDFNLTTLRQIPHFTQLLTSPVPEPALPTPPRQNLQPETLSSLHDTYSSYYCAKVNAALKVALGTSHPTMRAIKTPSSSSSRNQHAPDFISTYASDYTPSGGLAGPTGSARVVGLLRSFDTWNTGLRAEPGIAKIDYLRDLACLHRHMREHQCRYGFIITEIELVCVRAGTANVPYFGFLELAPPIKLAKSGPVPLIPSPSSTTDTDTQIPATLALWHLHMLAKNSPLPNQPPWKIDVGGPAALTRQHILPCKDDWMSGLKPEGREKREAKRNRGWVFPGDALSRREVGRGRRGVSSG